MSTRSNHVPLGQILEQFPYLNQSTIDGYDDPEGKGTWVWIKAIVSPFSRDTLDRYLKEVRCSGARKYVLKEEHEALCMSRGYRWDAGKGKWTRPANLRVQKPDRRWATEEEAWADYRLPRYLLTRFSREKHPLLGYEIRSEMQDRFNKRNHWRRMRVWWRAHLSMLRHRLDAGNLPRRPAGKIRLDEAVEEFGIPYPTLNYHAQRERLGAEKCKAYSDDGKLVDTWFVSRKLVAEFAAVDKDLGQREPVEIHGEPHCFLVEAADRAGVPWWHLRKYRNRRSPRWGEIVVQARPYTAKLFRSKWKEPWVYRAADLDRVRRFLRGEREPVDSNEVIRVVKKEARSTRRHNENLHTETQAKTHQAAAKMTETLFDHLTKPKAPATVVLSEAAQHCVGAMLALSATCSDKRRTAEEITMKADGAHADVNTYKRPLRSLVEAGLADVKKNRGGGYWLTAAGIERARTA
jgi:hypothetical protein